MKKQFGDSSASIRQISLDSMLVAMYAVLSLVAVPLGNMKLTLEGFPIIVGGLLYGGADGTVIGLMGSLINQLLTYGWSATTVLWIIPHGARGLIVGLYAKKHRFSLTGKEIVFITVVSALVTTTLNTVAMYLDAKIMGYYSKAYVFGSLAARYISGVLMAILFSAVLPALMKSLKRHLHLGAGTNLKEND